MCAGGGEIALKVQRDEGCRLWGGLKHEDTGWGWKSLLRRNIKCQRKKRLILAGGGRPTRFLSEELEELRRSLLDCRLRIRLDTA